MVNEFLYMDESATAVCLDMTTRVRSIHLRVGADRDDLVDMYVTATNNSLENPSLIQVRYGYF